MVSESFDLKGLLSIVEGVIRDMGAKRLVLDAIDVLLRFFNDTTHEQEQLFGLNDWLLEHAVTSVLKANAASMSSGYGSLEAQRLLASAKRQGGFSAKPYTAQQLVRYIDSTRGKFAF